MALITQTDCGTLPAGDIDVVVYAEFEDESALAAYKAHPLYAEATRRLPPLRECVMRPTSGPRND
jgi:hypothetical protein